MQQCISRHEHCQSAVYNRPLPTRVVDCTNPLEPKIVATDGSKGEYIALSYVWGEEQIHSTTQTNLEIYQDGIEISTLPQTIKDAIHVTYSLGCRFLWIDSLCILQDSDEDKRQEIANMRRIYSDAYLVVIAANAKKVSDGFLQARAPTPSQKNDTQLAFQLTGRQIGLFNFSLIWKDNSENGEDGEVYDPNVEPVNMRGWCFQEYMLAPRALVFTSHTLQYHCRTNIVNVGNSYDNSALEINRIPASIFSFASISRHSSSTLPLVRTPLSTEEWEVTRQAWFDAFINYTRRSISSPADKLVAFAAIAETFHKVWPQTRYVAGLWEDTLFEDLFWNKPPGIVGAPLPRPAPYRAPSWSWASVDGGVTAALKRWTGDGNPKMRGRCEVLACDVTLADPTFPYGMVTGGTLVIRAALVSALLDPSTEHNYVHAQPPRTVTMDGSGPSSGSTSNQRSTLDDIVCIGTVWLDSSDDAHLQEVWVAPMMWSRPIYTSGLILVPVNLDDKYAIRYRRIGILRTHAEAKEIDWINWQDPIEIVIE